MTAKVLKLGISISIFTVFILYIVSYDKIVLSINSGIENNALEYAITSDTTDSDAVAEGYSNPGITYHKDKQVSHIKCFID